MPGSPSPLVSSLGKVLQQLQQHAYPYVQNPEGCKKRASVTVILRIRPSFQLTPADSSSDSPDGAYSVIESLEQGTPPRPTELDAFFQQQWVQEGDPEVLFIKRAGRKGDRWSGHIALPGGKRDPEDADDLAAALRETREEIGLDLSKNRCLKIGNLPERVVTTTWGKEGLMVLCPFVFIITEKSIPPLQPQPTEVASLHWVPLRALLSPAQRTQELVDVSSRMARQGGPVAQKVLRFMLGKMTFSAVRLIPSESLFASSIAGFVPEDGTESVFSGLAEGAFGVPISSPSSYQQPLILWGLTLGVLADFLDMLPPHNAVKLWKYPTFTPLDLRFLIYLFTRSLRRNNAGDLSAGTWPSQTAVDATTQAVAVSEAEPQLPAQGRNDVGISGLGVGSRPDHAVGKLLSGYYERMNVAIGVFLVYRVAVGSAIVFWVVKQWRRRQRL